MSNNKKDLLSKILLFIRQRQGFTFIEILLVTTMIALIGLTIYSTFASGINFWMRINQQQTAEDVVIFLEKISYDLRNSFPYTGIDFSGSDNQISFPLLVSFYSSQGRKKTVGRVDYFFDWQHKSIKVKYSDYSQLYTEKGASERKLVENVDSLSFKYYYYSPLEKEFSWLDTWQTQEKGDELGLVKKKTIPLAVRIKVKIKDDNSIREFTKTVFIPAAYYLSFAQTK